MFIGIYNALSSLSLSGPQVPIVLVGNKSDLEVHRQVTQTSAEKTVSESMDGVRFFETSAKFDANVREVFLQLLQMAREQEEQQELLMEEQDLYRRKSRRLSRRLGRKLSCLNNTFALKRDSVTVTPAKASSGRASTPPKDANPKCVII